MARYELWKHAWHRYRMVAQNTLRTRGVNQVNNLIFLIHLFSSKATYFFLQKIMIYSNVRNMFWATIWYKYLGNISAHKKLNAKAFCNENKRWVGGRFGLFLESKHLLYGTPRKVPDYYIYIYKYIYIYSSSFLQRISKNREFKWSESCSYFFGS